jgi:hypothetical protein
MRKTFFALWILIVAWFCTPCAAENYTVEGDMGSDIRFEIRRNISLREGITKLTLSFVVPPSFQSPTYHQSVSEFELKFSPEPQEKKQKTNERGNQIITAVWQNPPKAVDVRLGFHASNRTKLAAIDTNSTFPLSELPDGVTYYVKATEQVQVDDPGIRKLAGELTQGVTKEFDAVQRVLTWVVDHVKYVTPPSKYDALYSLESGKGNCQNFSHLSAALLRAVGIPVRIVNGITLSKPFDMSRKGGVMTFKMGQGRHSWIEVWFPDLGWVPFDPQQTAMFVPNRFIRIEVGSDNNETFNDGLMKWAQLKGSDGDPTDQELIDADFTSDQVKVKGRQETYGPKNLLLCTDVRTPFKKVEVIPPPPPPVVADEIKSKLIYDVPFVFGNLDFPENIDFAFPPAQPGQKKGEKKKSFLVETAEYVTTKLTQYAQIFVLTKPVKLRKIDLALHNFGGDGQIWVDLFRDNNGKPGQTIATSEMVDTRNILTKPGYRWEGFDFRGEEIIIMPGAYWIGLGFTGSPIVSWFYTYGKPVGPVEGTRYKGVYEQDWSGALSYEFNYRLVGVTTKELASLKPVSENLNK